MRTVLRGVGYTVAALLALVVVAALAIYALSARRLRRQHAVAVTVPARTAAPDSAELARGRQLATAIGKCGDCHGDDLAGRVMGDDPAFGRLVSANLTRAPGGAAARLSDADFARAILHGVRADGTSLVVMPADSYAGMSARDFAALVAYVRSMPPVDHHLPATRLGPVARTLLVADRLPGFLSAEAVPAREVAWAPEVSPADTVAYGDYLAHLGGCTSCHGSNLAGGPVQNGPPGSPPAANLTRGGVAAGTEADFARTLRTGVRPGGTTVSPAMPVRYTRLMTDDEIHAVWRYLQSVPAQQYAARP